MFNTLKVALLTTVFIAGVAPLTAKAFDASNKEELGTFIREYIMENPEVIFQSVEKYQEEQKKKAEVDAQQTLKDNLASLTAADLPSTGNPDGDVTIIEFFDYNCGYCKRALPDIQKLLESDKNVRIVFHEMPILSDSSRLAAMWALAAHKQDKYFEFHSALMEFRGAKTADEMKKIAKRLKLDVEKLEEDAKSQEISTELAKSMELAQKLGVTGTPAFIVGDQIFRGYIPHDAMAVAIKQEREEG